MWIFIEPTDVWLFRDGRPFDAGSDHRAKSFFPPTPLTLQGAVRAKVLMQRAVSLPDYANSQADPAVIADIGLPGGDYGRLLLRGPIVAKARNQNQLPTQFFPVPADVLKIGDQPAVLRPLKDSPFHANLPAGLLPLWHHATAPRSEYERHWLGETAMRCYLEHESVSLNALLEERELFQRESRFHVGIDSAIKRPQEGDAGGHLFQIEFIRLCEDVGLLLEVSTQDGAPLPGFPVDGLLQLGGESRGAFYRQVDEVKRADHGIAEQALAAARFKVVFITPAYFDSVEESDKGWQPAGGDWSHFFSGAPVRLVSVALGRGQPIGGAKVDLKSQRGNLGFQKPIRRFIPAGSVYFFEADGPVNYTGRPVTETPSNEADFGQIGFGQILIGRWSYV